MKALIHCLCMLLGTYLLLAMPLLAGEDNKLEVVNLGEVNTAKDEVDPFLLPDGKRLLFSSNSTGIFQVMVSGRDGKEFRWSKGNSIAALNGKVDMRGLMLGPKNVLYYASNPVLAPETKVSANFDLFQKEGPRAPIPLIGVSTAADEMFPCISNDGKELYFNRNTDKGWQLMVANGPTAAPIGNAKLVENIPVDFVHATLTPDGKAMFLEGPVADNRRGIFLSKRSSIKENWSAPQLIVNLGDPSGKIGDTCPSLSSTGRTLLFASDREGGAGGMDLWAVRTSDLKTK